MTKEQTTYILSPYYELPEATDFIEEASLESTVSAEIEGLFSDQSFLLYHNIKDRLYVINPTIRYFLSIFSNPVTPNQVNEIVSKEANCEPKDVAHTLEQFANDMLKRKILIPHARLEEISAFKERMDGRVPMLVNGSDFHGYTIIKELAIRGKLELYIAECPTSQKECVIKALYLPQQLSQSRRKNTTKEFYQEFKLMEELKGHKNVCELYEIISDDQIPAASMEKIEGQSLRGWLRDQEKAPHISERIDVLVQVLSAIAWVQAKGIFHGDIHASNFLVHQGKAKLIDFDLANREVPEPNEILRKGGVYEYIAPECLKTNSFSWLKQNANHQSEVYQLGIIIYFTLYSKFPFKAITWQGLANKIVNEKAVFPNTTEQGEEIPLQVIQICKKCLSKNPSDRFKSAITLHRQFSRLRTDLIKLENAEI